MKLCNSYDGIRNTQKTLTDVIQRRIFYLVNVHQSLSFYLMTQIQKNATINAQVSTESLVS